MNNRTFDVIIIGSGPAGVHTAYPLIKAGLKIAIVDADGTNQSLKVKSNIKLNISYQKGGLSNVWPGICDYFTDKELKEVGLPAHEINDEYLEISKRIKLQRNLKLDQSVKNLLDNNIYQLPVAPYYKTAPAIDIFKKQRNFSYISNFLVTGIKEEGKHVEISSNEVNTNLMGKYLILAAGAINTNKILLQYTKQKNLKVPFLTKGYNLVICLNTKSLIKKRSYLTNPLGQAALSKKDFFIQFYGFNSSSLSKVSVPLPKRISSLIFSSLGPYLVIADVRFNTVINSCRFYLLRDDLLKINFKYTQVESKSHKKTLSQIKKDLIKKGLLPLKVIQGDVTSHYAGGVVVDKNAKLQSSRRIYIADAASWKMLPGKPPTLTIMANASRVGKNVLKNFK